MNPSEAPQQGETDEPIHITAGTLDTHVAGLPFAARQDLQFCGAHALWQPHRHSSRRTAVSIWRHSARTNAQGSTVHDFGFASRLVCAWRRHRRIGEAYVRGEWETSNLTHFLGGLFRQSQSGREDVEDRPLVRFWPASFAIG